MQTFQAAQRYGVVIPGRIRGRAFLYDAGRQRFLRAGDDGLRSLPQSAARLR